MPKLQSCSVVAPIKMYKSTGERRARLVFSSQDDASLFFVCHAVHKERLCESFGACQVEPCTEHGSPVKYKKMPEALYAKVLGFRPCGCLPTTTSGSSGSRRIAVSPSPPTRTTSSSNNRSRRRIVSPPSTSNNNNNKNSVDREVEYYKRKFSSALVRRALLDEELAFEKRQRRE